MSKKDMVLRHLLTGKSITQKEAIESYGAFRLSGIIYDLRNEGFDIATKLIPLKRSQYAQYKLIA